MATREENLKKINEELEKLDDEELDKIAGGLIMYMSVGDMKKDPAVILENQDKIIHVR